MDHRVRLPMLPVVSRQGKYICVCVFIKLHITAQSGPVILVILCHRIDPPKGGSMILVTKVCVCVCVCVCV